MHHRDHSLDILKHGHGQENRCDTLRLPGLSDPWGCVCSQVIADVEFDMRASAQNPKTLKVRFWKNPKGASAVVDDIRSSIVVLTRPDDQNGLETKQRTAVEEFARLPQLVAKHNNRQGTVRPVIKHHAHHQAHRSPKSSSEILDDPGLLYNNPGRLASHRVSSTNENPDGLTRVLIDPGSINPGFNLSGLKRKRRP